MFKKVIVTVMLLLVLTACQSSAGNKATATSLPPTGTSLPATQPVPTLVPATSTPTPASMPEATPTHIPVDLTPAQRAAIAQLSQDKGIPVDQIHLDSTEASQWENGCLGIVIPGVLCTKGPVDGFKIMLSANGSSYEYHTNQDGTSILLATSPFVKIAVRVPPDASVQIAQIDILASRNITPSVQGFNPLGGAVGGTVYSLDMNSYSVTATDAVGTRTLGFIAKANYGLAVWPGDASSGPLLAWGTQLDPSNRQTNLMTSAPDGSQLQILQIEQAAKNAPFQMIAQRWSADGKSLYFSKEPVGIGGYILYGGASSLYRIDLATQQITDLIPIDFQKGIFTCLDALSPDYSMVADHCTAGVITVRSLDTGHSVTILPPSEVTDSGVMGSARFSPDGSRLAFALAKGNPDAEQSWLAVSDGLDGGSKLVLTGKTGEYFTVLGWLDDGTLLVQINSLTGNSAMPYSVWTVNVDGTGLNKVTDGTFLTLVDQYKP